MNKSITIITASIRGELLDRVWDSIKKQTHKDWEWIIVNDNSNSVRFWLKEQALPDNVWTIDLGKNQGHYGLEARNVGAMCSSFDRVVFLDDDNEWETETYLENLIKAEEETGKIPHSNLRIRGKKPNSIHDRTRQTGLSSNNIDLGNLLYRKEFFKKYGYFDNSKNRIVFDWDFIKKIKKGEGEENFIRVNENLIFWHHRY